MNSFAFRNRNRCVIQARLGAQRGYDGYPAGCRVAAGNFGAVRGRGNAWLSKKKKKKTFEGNEPDRRTQANGTSPPGLFRGPPLERRIQVQGQLRGLHLQRSCFLVAFVT